MSEQLQPLTGDADPDEVTTGHTHPAASEDEKRIIQDVGSSITTVIATQVENGTPGKKYQSFFGSLIL